MILRFTLIRYLVYLGLLGLLAGLFRVQVVEGERYRKMSEQNRIRLIPLEAPRGRVFDRQGRVLAGNRVSYNLVATPEDVTPEVFSRLAELLGISEEEVRRRMSASREYPFTPALIAEDIDRELAFKVEERRPELPGTAIQVQGIRYYPYHTTASHLIGYIGKINREEYHRLDRSRFGMTSLVGRAGIEQIYDERLRGWRGGRQIEVDARGKLIRVLQEKEAVPGEDLTVTLDLELQKSLDELIEDQKASIAVLDLKTGGMLALASSPAYDPNVFVTPGMDAERLEVLTDSRSPLLDRGTGSAYPPGSVFKVVTALAALESGRITPHTSFNCSGSYQIKPGTRPFKCWMSHGHGKVNLYQAIERSCNVYFYNLGKRLSVDHIARYARELGLGRDMQLEVTHLTPGLVPDSEWKKQKYHEKWYKGDTLSFVIGQSYLLTSPVQILRLVSIIANDGIFVEPRILAENLKPQKEHVAIQPKHLRTIKKAMLQVVESNMGTGQFARVDFEKMAAKTGTAQAPPHDSHSWIAGFFPYKSPRIAFVVFVEHGGPGGITAAGIAKDMITQWRTLNGPALA